MKPEGGWEWIALPRERSHGVRRELDQGEFPEELLHIRVRQRKRHPGGKSPERELESPECGIVETKGRGRLEKEAANSNIWCIC